MEWIRATDGRKLHAATYFKLVFPAVSAGFRMLSPAEVGCSLSHIEVLKRFLDSAHERCLVIEDDVLGKDEGVNVAIEQMLEVPGNAVVIFGGQEGMPSRKYILGKAAGFGRVYRLPKYSNNYVLRTCCYGVTRESAKAILDSHDQCLKLADAWGEFFKCAPIDIYFSEVFSHPEDRSASHIEQSRIAIGKSSKGSAVLFLKKRWARLKRKLGALACLLMGYRRVS
ncbi:MAG: Glycosyltransferase involved in LPS biosynthesis [Marinobacter excellens HL-55]|uniref:Glycosyltransferase involved in LPS biosynthesis n=1 Tax=Marinobacter excellens HL-55 TaxID=1305731 RepID=A0A0N8KKF5_9GAMM|nr:MAG: Glycosyltransferase involved in LPS biosynthesis [Marinobacter excellens HL-55]